MIFQIIYFLTLISFLIYLYYLKIFFVGLRNKNGNISHNKPRVSVVIAARNESENISRLLTSLVNQSYPINLYEVIIADDDSSDNTTEIVKTFSKKWNNIKLIQVKGRKEAVSPKKNALSQAIETSDGEVLLSTDADCIVGKYWIESMVAGFNENEMVIGFSRTKINNWKKSHLIQKFEHFDFLTMFIVAAGAISSGKYFSCSGQNIGYKKSDFQAVCGFEKIKHIVSGDDINLMQLFRKSKMKVEFAFSTHSFVYTKAVDNLLQLLRQRSRWASNMKWQIILNPEFFIYLLSVFFVTILPIILLFKCWWLGLGIIFIRVILEFQFLKLGYMVFNEEKN
ncbi:MAG: glycosyltransferase, partial [Candidatus Cloacimonetes bacterium]|nr:glycosyltransferase [Candidatus Cloacimonadota bacterium]